jgi:GT2 family glycosyltransferase
MTKHVAMILGYHNPRLSMLATDSVLAAGDADVILVEPDARKEEVFPLRARYGDNPRVILLFLKENKYCAWGMNQGIKAALQRKYDFITVMNNDATVDAGYFDEMDREFRVGKGIGLIQPKTMFGFTDIIYSAGTGRNIIGFPLLRGHGQPDKGQYARPEYVDYASMVVATVRAQVFRDVGLLDEDYVMYYDDIDFSMRAAKKGWSVRYTPWAVARHHTLQAVGQTNRRLMGFVTTLSERNKLLMGYKNGHLSAAWIAADLLHSLKFCVLNPLLAPALIRGKAWFLADWMTAIPRERRELGKKAYG